MEVFVSRIKVQKPEWSHLQCVWIGWESMGAASWYSGEGFLNKVFRHQLASLSFLSTRLLLDFLNNTNKRSKSNEPPPSSIVPFLLCTQPSSITFQPETLIRVQQSVQFILSWFRKSTLCPIVVLISRKWLLLKTWCSSVMNTSIHLQSLIVVWIRTVNLLQGSYTKTGTRRRFSRHLNSQWVY